MEHLFFRQVQCPYCGESIELELDSSAGEHGCIEDCSVCCRPIEVRLFAQGDEWRVEVQREDD